MDITLVVCTFNRSGLLLECLQSLVDQSISADRYEVVVVNNNSTDDTQEATEKFCRVHTNFRVVVETEQGHSQARNRGWREACGKYIAYIDDDCLADKMWAERILQAFSEVNPPPTAVGGVILPRYDNVPPAWFIDQLETRSWGNEEGFLKPPLGKYGFSGANMAFPRQVLEEFGGFSLSYGIVNGSLKMGEDTDIFLRLDAAGRSSFWFDPEIRVSHLTPSELFSPSFRLMRSYNCGRSHIGFEVGPIGLFFILRVLVSVPIQLVKGVGLFLKPAGSRLAHGLRCLENTAHQTGLLVEGCRTVLMGKE